jgi:hypothetical protein
MQTGNLVDHLLLHQSVEGAHRLIEHQELGLGK